MSLARGLGRAVRWLAGFGRIVLAVGLLVALWIGTVTGVERASRTADERRASDRSAVAAGFAASVRDWVDAGQNEAITLARSVGEGGGQHAQAAIEAFLSQPQTFSHSALVFAGQTVTAASAEHAVLVGLHPKPCTRRDETGASVADTRLDALVAEARSATAPVVSPILDVPGGCRPTVGIAVATGSVVTVAFGDLADVASRLDAGALITDTVVAQSQDGGADIVRPSGTRILLITGDLAFEPRHDVVSVTSRAAAFVRDARATGPRRGRYPTGEDGEAQVLAAYAPVTGEWSVVLEQDAAVFDLELQNRPSIIVATALTVVFAVVFALLAFFDVRRKRAQRRTEVTKNAFFSIAGHELRTPLTVIKGFAETLSTNWDDVDERRRRMLVERIVPQARRLDRLVERLLVAASIQAQTHTRPQIGDLDAVQALEEVAERFRPEAPLHSFLVQADDDVPSVKADPQAFAQILEHLIDNAVKYSPSGGRVLLRVVYRQKHVHVIVEDEGVGLPADQRHIFDRFVQGESVTKRVHDEGGVGLGLYIVRTLVEQMGGSVRAEPRVREGGARFIVSLKPAPEGGLVRSGHADREKSIPTALSVLPPRVESRAGGRRNGSKGEA